MKILPDPATFVWDKGNIDKNLDKHGVTNKEVEESFQNKPVYLFKDELHSTKKEIRYGMFGITDKRRRVSLVFTLRKENIRVITVRDMSRKERRAYEKIKTDTKV